jgi:hypothetical protein
MINNFPDVELTETDNKGAGWTPAPPLYIAKEFSQ